MHHAADPGGATMMGITIATLAKWRKRKVTAAEVRQMRRDEAVAISAALMTSHRTTNKRLMSIGQAVEVMRANGEVRAERTDPATGELVPLSDSDEPAADEVRAVAPPWLAWPPLSASFTTWCVPCQRPAASFLMAQRPACSVFWIWAVGASALVSAATPTQHPIGAQKAHQMTLKCY